MKCGMTDEMLLAWVDGDLDAAERARVSEHIVACGECHRIVGDLKAVTGALERWQVPEPPALPSPRELLDRAAVPAPSTGRRRWSEILRQYGAVAGIVLFAAVSGLVILPRYLSSGGSHGVGPAPAESAKAPAAADRTAASNAGAATPGPSAPERTSADAAATPAGSTAPPVEGPAEEKAGAVAQPEDNSAAEPAPKSDAPADTVGELAAEPPAPATKAADEPAPPPPAAQPAGGADRQEAEAGGERTREDANRKVARPAAPAAAGRSATAFGAAVVHRADVTMSGDDAGRLADRIADAARAENGTVTKRWARDKNDGSGSITVELSVPADRFERTLSRLRSAGRVQAERRSAIDLSQRMNEIDSELSDDRDAKAGKSKDALKKERRSLESRADRAIIVVTIVEKP